jgi:hypothetical protein
MGPYYLTALVCALGPVAKVTARSSQARDTRVIGSGPRAGEKFPVEVPTNVVRSNRAAIYNEKFFFIRMLLILETQK